MAGMNVGAAISPAMKHTGRLLFRPFALRKWLALGFVSMLSGASGGGSAHFNLPSGNSRENAEAGRVMVEWAMSHLALIIAGFVLLTLVSIALSWLGSVLKFVYLNQITRDPCAIKAPFGWFIGLGTSYWLWGLAFGFVVLIVAALLIGVPLGLIFVSMRHGSMLVLGIVWAVVVGIGLAIAVGVIGVFAQDFVTAAMFARGVKVLEGWRIVLQIVRANVGQSALYVLLVVAIGIALGIASLFAMLFVGIAFLIVGGVFALIGYGLYTAGGWSPLLIGYSVVMGFVLLMAFCYVLNCVLQPIIVFKRTLALVVVGQAAPSLATIPA